MANKTHLKHFLYNFNALSNVGVSVEFVKTTDSIQESNAVLRVDVEILGQRSVPVVVT